MIAELLAKARRRLPVAEQARVRALRLPDAGHGWDVFGLHPDGVGFGLWLTRVVYERWFRVVSHGIENIPGTGGALLCANHSGTLPFDAAMVWADIVRRSDPPRVPRTILDHFVGELPFVGTLFCRVGAVGGSRSNMRALLEAGELLLVFPEGTEGIGKPARERYRLQRWRVGHAELALRHRVPVVPVAVIGAEEAFPQLARLPVHAFGSPYVPIPRTPVPLPARFHIWYGAPLALHERFGADAADAADAADDPAVVRAAADVTRAAVAELLARGLAERRSVFG